MDSHELDRKRGQIQDAEKSYDFQSEEMKQAFKPQNFNIPDLTEQAKRLIELASLDPSSVAKQDVINAGELLKMIKRLGL